MFQQKEFENLLGISWISGKLLQNHLKLYQGYVTNTNKLIEPLKKTPQGTPEFSELTRRFGWEFNGIRLHELYFENISADKRDIESEILMDKIKEQFGSFELWKADFKAKGMMRGIGWIVLYLDEETGKMFNVWINEHDVGHLAGCKPLVVLDVFEHAFMLDFVPKDQYIDLFLEHIDWNVVEERLEG